MKNRILIIALLGAMFMIVIASASPSNIKKVILDPKTDPDKFDVTVGTKEDNKVNEIDTNGNRLNKEGNDWKGVDISRDNDGIFTIRSRDNSGYAEKKYGNGGCTGNYEAHNKLYQFAQVDPVPVTGSSTTFYLNTENRPGASLIQICAYPIPGFDPETGSLDIALPLINKWVPKHSGHKDYFGFGRIKGTDTIPIDGSKNREIGTASYGSSTDSHQILMHIYDPEECANDNDAGKDAIPGKTCWRRPGPSTQIPEFPTIALPIAAMIGLVFIFQHRRNKEE